MASKDHDLSILHLNIRSIRNKTEYIDAHFSDFDILCFTETHLDGSVDNNSINLEHYNKPYRKDVSAHSSGILIYTNTSISSKSIDEFDLILPDSLWIKINNKDKTLILCVVYRRPNTSIEFWNNLNICIERACEMCDDFILVGDINEDQLNISNNKLKDILVLNNLTNIITEPTRITDHSSTLLDPIVVSNKVSVHSSGTYAVPANISDHKVT
jgi:exonuclease III